MLLIWLTIICYIKFWHVFLYIFRNYARFIRLVIPLNSSIVNVILSQFPGPFMLLGLLPEQISVVRFFLLNRFWDFWVFLIRAIRLLEDLRLCTWYWPWMWLQRLLFGCIKSTITIVDVVDKVHQDCRQLLVLTHFAGRFFAQSEASLSLFCLGFAVQVSSYLVLRIQKVCTVSVECIGS